MATIFLSFMKKPVLTAGLALAATLTLAGPLAAAPLSLPLVGWAYDAGGNYCAFLWDKGAIYNLNEP